MRGRTGVWLALLAVLSLAYAGFAHWLSTAQGQAVLGPWARSLPWIYFLQHVALFCALAAWFGVSLRPGREARVTRFARHAGDHLDDAGLAYTRGVTLAWTVFCAAMAATSVLLFFLGPIDLWSLFANLLSLPLVGAMFLAEYAVRLRVCPALARGGILRGVAHSVRAYRDSGMRTTVGPR